MVLRCVSSPGEVVGYICPRRNSILNSMISLVLLVLSSRLCLEHQPVNLVPVCSLIPSADEADDCSVICKFNDGFGRVDGCSVIRIQGIQERAQHTALGGACAEGQGGGAGGAYLNHLRAVSQEVLDPGTDGGGESDVDELVHQDIRNNGVKCQAVVYEQHPNVTPWLLQVAKRCMKSCSDGVFHGSVSSVGELMCPGLRGARP